MLNEKAWQRTHINGSILLEEFGARFLNGSLSYGAWGHFKPQTHFLARPRPPPGRAKVSYSNDTPPLYLGRTESMDDELGALFLDGNVTAAHVRMSIGSIDTNIEPSVPLVRAICSMYAEDICCLEPPLPTSPFRERCRAVRADPCDGGDKMAARASFSRKSLYPSFGYGW